MVKHQKIAAILGILGVVTPFLSGAALADTNEIPIPNGNQTIQAAAPTPVDVIVTDNKGNMTEQQVPYNPQTQTVVVNNNYGGDNSSVFFPLFAAGFMFWGGYWVGHNGSYWNGSHYVHVTNVNWNQHWNNYWQHSWAPKWKNYSHNHQNDPHFKYHQQGQNWHDNAGHWHNGNHGDQPIEDHGQRGGNHGDGGREGRGGGMHRGGGGHR